MRSTRSSRLTVGEPEYQAADEVLHTRIVAASGNQFFRQMTAIVRGALVTVNPIVDGIEAVREATLAAQRGGRGDRGRRTAAPSGRRARSSISPPRKSGARFRWSASVRRYPAPPPT